MQQYLQNKKGLVQSVFDKVYNKYDLMNDFMSLGIHRIWKKNLINMMSPSLNSNLIDVACGTGDIGKLFLDNTKIDGSITCVDPNKGMISKGKEKLNNYKNINKALAEAHRVLKPGGRFFCLEFSKILNSNLELLYKNYSKLIPLVGELIVGEKKPYEYLVKSIENFVNQEELIALMEQNNFKKCSYRNLSGGIVSIHSGWKY